MKIARKILSLSLCGAMVLSLSGCGDTDDSKNETTKEKSTTTTTTAIATTKQEEGTTTAPADEEENTTTTTTTENPSVELPKEASIDIEPLDWYSSIPSGSAITSMATVLHYYGYEVKLSDLWKFVEAYEDPKVIDGKTPSPWEKIIFDPSTDLSIVYAPPIVNMANKYLESVGSNKSAVDISGKTVEELLSYVAEGKPVIVWATDTGEAAEDGTSWIADNGEKVIKKKDVRVYVISAYNEKNVTLLIDWGSEIECSFEQLREMYESVYSQAIIIE